MMEERRREKDGISSLSRECRVGVGNGGFGDGGEFKLEL